MSVLQSSLASDSHERIGNPVAVVIAEMRQIFGDTRADIDRTIVEPASWSVDRCVERMGDRHDPARRKIAEQVSSRFLEQLCRDPLWPNRLEQAPFPGNCGTGQIDLVPDESHKRYATLRQHRHMPFGVDGAVAIGRVQHDDGVDGVERAPDVCLCARWNDIDGNGVETGILAERVKPVVKVANLSVYRANSTKMRIRLSRMPRTRANDCSQHVRVCHQ
jgi:hypothetical protein